MRADDAFDLVAGKRQYARDHAPWTPAETSRGFPGHPLVPADLPFEGTQVVEPGLDLDDQERPSAMIEGEKVDPTV